MSEVESALQNNNVVARTESRSTPSEPRWRQFEFHGNVREYFGIWLVNLLLTLLTLGIYSAWAKVRSNRYFYGNTVLDGSAFDYTADPKKILLGRVIAVVLFLLYQGVVLVFPTRGSYTLLAFACLLPLIYVTSIAFKMRYTEWRGISFSFGGSAKYAYFLFTPIFLYFALIAIGDSIIYLDSAAFAAEEERVLTAIGEAYFFYYAIIVVGGLLLFPLWQCFYYRFLGNNLSLGAADFSLQLDSGSLYGLSVGAAFIALFSAVLVGMPLYVLGVMLENVGSSLLIILSGYITFFVPYVLAFAFYQTQLTNLLYSEVAMPDIKFRSNLEFTPMVTLYLTNTLAILFTLGLAIPWARIRMAQYRANHMFAIAFDLNSIARRPASEVGAGADAVSDVFDLDIGL